jgi:DNA-binding response OmpR family regulator
MSEGSEVLLVEDADDDIQLILGAFHRAGMEPPFVVKDGEAALAYLSGKGLFSARGNFPPPAMVLLNLSLPGMDGFEVLRWIREGATTRGLTVLVLTSSPQVQDVRRAYELGADSFLVKDLDFGDAAELLNFIRKHLHRKSGVARRAA